MPRFCKYCGSKLKAEANFCPECGKPTDAPQPVQPAAKQAPSAQPPKPVQPVAKQAPSEQPPQPVQAVAKQAPSAQPPQPVQAAAKQAQTVQKAAKQAASAQPPKPVQKAAKQAAAAAAPQVRSAAAEAIKAPLAELTEQIAPSQPGETVLGVFGDVSGAAANITAILNPFKTVISGIKSFVQNLIGLFKNKQWGKLIIAGVLAVAWVVLMILRRNGVSVGILNWLTFAQGGAGRSAYGGLGGLLGKTTVATMFFSLPSGGFKSLGSGFKSLFSGANFKTNNLGLLLFGAGGALMLYQFFAGSASWTDSMPAISGALLSVMALGRGNGFLYQFVQSLTAKKVGTSRVANNEKIGGLLSGVTYGFALGALVSALPFGWMPVIMGGACLIAGIVLTIVFGNKKEVAAV